MTRSTTLFAGIIGSFALSCFALVLAPQAQLGGLQPQFTDEEGKITDIYPIQNTAADQGRGIYIREGCVTCHSQQVRDPQSGADIERGWGARRTVARDYLFERPPLLGSMRIGPDLANAGSPEWRDEPKDDLRKPVKRDAAWHYLHLYSPRVIVTESNHPPYRYLFEERPILGQKSLDAVQGLTASQVKPGHEIVPKPAARSLVAYLLSLDRSHAVKEVAAPAAAAAPTSSAPAK